MNAIVPQGSMRIVDGQIMVDSRDIADMFGKRHADVLRVINEEIQGNERNFALVEYTDAKGEKRPSYLLTKTAAIAIAMSFTGDKARQLRWAIVQRMEELERQLHGSITREDVQAMIDASLNAVPGTRRAPRRTKKLLPPKYSEEQQMHLDEVKAAIQQHFVPSSDHCIVLGEIADILNRKTGQKLVGTRYCTKFDLRHCLIALGHPPPSRVQRFRGKQGRLWFLREAA